MPSAGRIRILAMAALCALVLSPRAIGIVYTVDGKNKFSTFDSCTITQQNPNGDFDLIGSLSEVGPLRFNGGATMTRALLAPSNMINGANATAGCSYAGTLLVDQRGGPRGQGAQCDLGAFELGALPAGSLSADGFELGQLWAW